MAWPTRTVAAMPMPNGTMNRMAATCSAIWCAASAVVLIRPIRSPAAPNRPYSSRKENEIGAPMTMSFHINRQSTRQERPTARGKPHGREERTEIDDGGRQSRAEQAELRQAERAIQQEIDQQRIGR